MPATQPIAATERARHRGFVNRALDFANRASSLPGFPGLPIAGIAVGALMVVVGAFGTGQLPLGTRIGLWAVLLGWNVLKWQVWFAWRVRRPGDWSRAATLGALVLNLPLPIEIALTLRLFGIGYPLDPMRTWIEALAISAAIFASVLAFRHRGGAMPDAVPVIRHDGLLARAGIRTPGALLAIEAEDHYCRLHLAGGRTLLIHHRFGDALTEVAGFDGAQVHRSAWVAAAGVAGARRDGRRWSIVLPGGATVPVSGNHAAAARARGWLRHIC